MGGSRSRRQSSLDSPRSAAYGHCRNTMIREALPTDIDRIVEMGSRSLRDGPYRDEVGDSPKTTAALCQQVLESGKILVAEEDGNVIGVLGFIVFPHYFSGERTAGELIWYV